LQTLLTEKTQELADWEEKIKEAKEQAVLLREFLTQKTEELRKN
jgi:hypothetical protein